MRSIEDRAFQRVDEKGNRYWIHFLWPPRRSLMALQMTWHARCRKGGVAPLGLKNLGNSCYLNSVLQCLTYTPPLAQFCLSFRHSSLCKSVFANREECPFCILERQIARSLTLDGANTTESPSKILKCLSLFAEHFRWGRQEDAHEFLRYVIDACHNACIKIHKQSGGGGASGGVANGDSKVDERSGPGTVMKEIFGGALLSQVKCLGCKGDSNKVDEIMDICLDVSQSSSLKDALARFFQPEVLDGNNKYSCSNCKKLSVAKKQMFILRAPNVLVIQLKRFEGIHGGKINRNIDFDELLGLSKFMSNTSQDPEPEYSLFGCIVHLGFSPESGHYYAYIKDASGRWFCCNDAHVSLSSSQEVLSEKVYMLFYIRTNCSPKPNKSALSCKGFKPSIVNGSSVESQKIAETLKPMIANTNGASSTNNGSALLKNSKAFSSSQFKPINLKNLETKRTFPNDNGKFNIQKKRAIGEDTTIHACNSLTENKMLQKFETLTTSNLDAANVDVSPDIVRQQNKHTPLWPNGNQCSHPSDKHPNTEDTESAAAIRKGSSNSSSPKPRIDKHHKVNSEVHNAKNRENPDTSSNGSTTLPRENGSCKNQLSCEKRHSREIEKFKEMLSEEASTELHSCGWVDRVQDFMRAKKRLCMQAADASYDKSSIRKQLISDAKKTFILQIPESLKERLIERLRSFSQETPLLDP